MILDEAARALSDIENGRRIAREHRTYAAAGPTLIIWGVVWLTANLTSQFELPCAPLFWLAGSIFALIWSFTRRGDGQDDKVLATWLVAAATAAALVLSASADFRTATIMVALLVAGAYLVAGIWIGRRFFFLGGLLSAAIVAGWLITPAWLFLLLAFGGGGTLLIGGLWLLRA